MPSRSHSSNHGAGRKRRSPASPTPAETETGTEAPETRTTTRRTTKADDSSSEEPNRLEQIRERANALGQGILGRLGRFYRDRPRASVALGVLGGILVGRRLFRRTY
jgi:hypothetical protein